MGMVVRRARADDAEELVGVHVRTWQAAYAHAFPAAYLRGLTGELAARTVRWRAILDSGVAPQQTFVAVDEDRVIGFVACGRERGDGGGAGEVYAFYVEPSHWSTGVGRALMDAAVAHLYSAGLTTVRLWVLDDNPRARAFYERYGFVHDGTTKRDTIGADSPHATEVTEVRYELR
jgi:ribosomal protein S18 acetylase RimI-like enzyme